MTAEEKIEIAKLLANAKGVCKGIDCKDLLMESIKRVEKLLKI